MGHLEEASQESEKDFLDISSEILAERKNMDEDLEYHPELMPLLESTWKKLLEEADTNGHNKDS